MAMTTLHLKEVLIEEADAEAELTLPMTVGAGSVDPRLIEPDHDEPDVEDVIAFRCSAL